MKQMFVYLLVIMTISAPTCKNEEENCHYNIKIKNNSSNQIISAIPIHNAENKCKLDGKTLNSGEQYIYRPFNFSIENSLNNNTFIEIYIVDTAQFNSPNAYYSCDSIEIKNKVLKHFVLSLNDLKKRNFAVTYP